MRLLKLGELAAAFRTDHKEQQLDLDRARDLIAKYLGGSTSRSATPPFCRPIS